MIRHYEGLDENLYTHKLPNGLTVKVVPRRGFAKKLAYFVTDYGSVHTRFTLDGQSYHVPDGVAHFLEHKMFELPGRDVSGEFAALGANVNAFTSYDMTAYYFSCTERFPEALRLLVEFVSTAYFPEDSVQREMGIIDQEIGMTADSPERVFENLMEIMYRAHPIRVPILGSKESIRQITPEILHACHRAFYHPENMILCVMGDVDPEEVVAIARQVLGDEKTPAGIKAPIPSEALTCPKDYVSMNMEVAMPNFQVGFKCAPTEKGPGGIRQEIIGELASEVLFGEASRLYMELYEQGLIDSSFGGGFETVDGCALLTCGGDSDDAPAVVRALLERSREIVREGVPEEDFLRIKRSALGRRIRDLDSFDSTCFRLCAYHFADFDYFDFPAVYAAVTAEDVRQFIETVVTPAGCALSVIQPKEE